MARACSTFPANSKETIPFDAAGVRKGLSKILNMANRPRPSPRLRLVLPSKLAIRKTWQIYGSMIDSSEIEVTATDKLVQKSAHLANLC